jgi:hypothetical protein
MHRFYLLLNPTLGVDIVKVEIREGIRELGNVSASEPKDLGEVKDRYWPKDENAVAIENIVQTIMTTAK